MGFILSKLAFQPPRITGAPPANAIYCKTTGGAYVPIVHYEYPGAAYTLIWSHGNAADLFMANAFLLHMRKTFRCSVVGYDYVGYGYSYQFDGVTGVRAPAPPPSEDGCYDAIDAVYHHVCETLEVPLDRQVWVGESIGSGPTLDLVARLTKLEKRVGGVILVSPFWSVTRIVSAALPWLVDMFANGEKIRDIEVPVLIVHGTRDELVPPAHSQWLADACATRSVKLVLIEGARHNTVLLDIETFNHVWDFLKALPHNKALSMYALPTPLAERAEK